MCASRYMDWRMAPDGTLPPPALPEGRRSFGCPEMARAGELHTGCRSSRLAAVRDLLPVAAGIAKGSDREGPIPAGYTYLGQFLAHDLCAPSEGVFDYALNGAAVAVRQPRAQDRAVPLHLETLFGPLAHAAPLPLPYRFACHADWPYAALDLPRQAEGAAMQSRVAVHDSRNDDTPMVSQLAGLFLALARWAEEAHLAQGLTPQKARCAAQAGAAQVWHRILRRDYLPRLCLPECDPAALAALPAEAAAPAAVPVELSHAVLRMGHWMVRSAYRLNEQTVPTSKLLSGQSGIEQRRARRGAENLWRIDWRHFFPLEAGVVPQCGLALSDGVAAMFGADFALPEGMEIHAALVRSDNDLALRDLARSLDGGLQSVATLAARLAPLRSAHPGWCLWNAAARQAMMAAWFAARDLDPPPGMTADPPLYLYVLAESGAGPAAQGYGRGRSLGALGSSLLQGAVLTAITAAERAFPPDLPAAPAGFDAIASMPDLIRFLSTPPATQTGACP